MCLEALVYLLIVTPIYSLIEVFYWDQIIRGYENQVARLKGDPERKVVCAMGLKTYWLVHPLIPAVGIFLLTYNILFTVGMTLVYGVLQDILYFVIVRRLGSDKWYTNQTWMPKWGNTNVPTYYIMNAILALIFFIGSAWFYFYPIWHIMGL